MDDSPSTVGTIEEERLDIKLSDSLYHENLYNDNFISLPPPPPIFSNRQNSIQSNNSKDNEIYSIFSNPNTSYNSINESVDSFDQIYHHDYDLNQSLDSIPDSLIDNSTINSNLNITSNTTQSAHLFQVNQNFDTHNHSHQNQNFLQANANDTNFQFFNSYDNTPDNFDFYHPDNTSPRANSITHSPSFTNSQLNYNLSLQHNPAMVHPNNNNRFGVHKYNSEMNLSVNTKIPSYNRYGSLSSMSNPNSAISASGIPPTSASSSIPTSASTSTPVKLENGSYLQLATFRHNPQSFHTLQPQHMHQTHTQAHMGNQVHANPHQNSVLHPSNPYLSPRRKPRSDYSDSNTPTTTATNSISNPNSRSNSVSHSPLNSSMVSLNNYNMASNHAIPNLQQSASDKGKKHTRRRLLPRSKNGCWICRIKHLKCDEMRPSCSSCEKFGIHCDYSPEKPLYVSDKNLRTEKLLEITQIRKSNQRLKSKVSKKRLKEITS